MGTASARCTSVSTKGSPRLKRSSGARRLASFSRKRTRASPCVRSRPTPRRLPNYDHVFNDFTEGCLLRVSRMRRPLVRWLQHDSAAACLRAVRNRLLLPRNDPARGGLRSAWLDVNRVVAEIAESDLREANEAIDRIDYSAMSLGDLAEASSWRHTTPSSAVNCPGCTSSWPKCLRPTARSHSELSYLTDVFADLRHELESHMFKEERILFPLIKRLEAARAPSRSTAGRSKTRSGSWSTSTRRSVRHWHEWRCSPAITSYPPMVVGRFRALYDGLASLEADLHRHIHKENNILFPRAAALESAVWQTGT